VKRPHETVSLVIVGHVDHGKSTLIGRLLHDTGSLPPDRMEEIKRASEELGRDTEFAYLLDHLEEERQQGITIDTTQVFFKTDKRQYVIIDAPGHVEFVKNMITGASQAEAALLIIDVREGMREQTKRHAYLFSLLGIREVVVVVNKMDLAGNDREAFETVKRQAEEFLRSLSIKPRCCIPISAIRGDNVVRRNTDIGWYEGPTVLESLDSLEVKVAPEKETVVFPVQDIYNIDGERIIVGKVEAGTVKSGGELEILPGRSTFRIRSIKKFSEIIEESSVGESIGITTQEPLFVDRGNVICSRDSGLTLADEFRSNLFWMDRKGFKKDERLTLRIVTQETACKVDRILRRIDSSSLRVIEENAQCLENLEVGEVIIKTKKPVAMKRFDELESLGRFILLRGEDVCAGGIII